MKILLINGSHRKGNSSFIVNTIFQQIESLSQDNQLELVNLREKNIDFCDQNDYNCRKSQNCTCCRDDMQEIYALMEKSDLIVFASPIYFSNVSARMKNLMDRCNPYFWNKKLINKKAALVGFGQSPNNQQFFACLAAFCQTLGMKVIGKVYGRGQYSNEAQHNQALFAQIKEFSKTIINSN